jgi:tRNA(Ile)-lysidine synthase
MLLLALLPAQVGAGPLKRALFIWMGLMTIVAAVSSFLSRLQPDDSLGSEARVVAAAQRPVWHDTSKIVVAVSGGPDSLALLHGLLQIVAGERLVTAHLDHGWRAASAADADYVRRLADSWGVACYTDRIDTVEVARAEGLSLEEAGRQARYRFLAQVAEAEAADFVATGHTADDQAETVLMNLLRGSGLTGLRGILPSTTVPGSDKSLHLIRPLLEVSREAVLAYCLEQQLRPLEDPSNQDLSFWRNRVRHQLLPLLNDHVTGVAGHLQQLALTAAADDQLLAELTENAWNELLEDQATDRLELNLAGWRALPLSLRRRTLRYAMEQLRSSGQNVGFRTIEQARQVAETAQVGAQSTLPGDYRLVVEYEHLVLQAATAVSAARYPQLPGSTPLALSPPTEMPLANGWLVSASWLAQPDLAAISHNRDPWVAFVDGEEAGELQMRPRRPGERFQPLGMGGRSAKLKEVMIDRKIPAALRARWPLVAGEDHLVWLVGYGIDERARVTPSSRRVLQLHCRRDG